MDPIRLTETGEMLIVPGRPGITGKSRLPVDGMLGYHDWKGCPRGVIYLHEVIGGLTVVCKGCGLHLEVPGRVKTFEDLREFLKKEFAR